MQGMDRPELAQNTMASGKSLLQKAQIEPRSHSVLTAKDMSVGQNQIIRGPQVLVYVSICQGKPFRGYPIHES